MLSTRLPVYNNYVASIRTFFFIPTHHCDIMSDRIREGEGGFNGAKIMIIDACLLIWSIDILLV